MSNPCRICMEDDKQIPLHKRCDCSSGFFHDLCFVKWIAHRSSLECEVCNNYFTGAFIQYGIVRAFSSISFKFFYIITFCVPMLSGTLWVSLKNFSDLVYCVHNKHSSTCGHYNNFMILLLCFNIMVTIFILVGISVSFLMLDAKW